MTQRKPKKTRHSARRVSFFRYSHYDIAFKFFVEQILDAEYVTLPPRTKKATELGVLNSMDYVCAPFKHILGDYIEALETGANVLIQFGGPCRLGYYGELHEKILRDLGYDFTMLNFAEASGKPLDYIKICKKAVNPNLSLPAGAAKIPALVHLAESLDAIYDLYLANAGFQCIPGQYEAALESFYEEMRRAKTDADVRAGYEQARERMALIRLNKPERPIRIGIIGELFTAIDQDSNLHVERKLLNMGVELHRSINLTNRSIHHEEEKRRASAQEYIQFDMGPTSTLTISSAKEYAESGFDGLIHIKCSGCTPEVDCIPVLQRLGRDYEIPILYLSYEAQTSDAGLETRLEAFCDMLAMAKKRSEQA